jgi:Tfp pilus assembly protein PilO
MNVQLLGKIPKRRIDQVALALTILVAVGLSVTFLGRGAAALHHVQTQEKTLVDRLEYLNEVATMLGAGEETLNFLEDRSEQLNERLPLRIDFQSFYAEFTRMAERTGVNLLEVQQQDIHAEPDYLELPIEIRAEATYEDLYGFLHAISTMPRLVKVHSIDIGMSERNSICSVEADLRIYSVNVANVHD